MNEVEQRVRQFVREGHIPVMAQPAMLDRVERGMRQRRRVKTAILAAASVVIVGGVGFAVTNALRGDSGDSPVAADPDVRNAGESDCSQVTVLTAATSTAPEGSSRNLAILLSLNGDEGADAGCAIGAGTRVELSAGQQSVSVEAPDTVPAVPLRAGDQGILELQWSNWCGEALPRVAVTFVDGSRTEQVLPEGTATPSCVDADQPSTLVVERMGPTDVQNTGSELGS